MNWEMIGAVAIVCVIVGVLAHKYLSAKAVKDAVANARALARHDYDAILEHTEALFTHKAEAPAPVAAEPATPAPEPAAAPAPAAPAAPVDVPATHATLDKVIADAQATIDKAKAAKDKLTADVATATAAAVAAIK